MNDKISIAQAQPFDEESDDECWVPVSPLARPSPECKIFLSPSAPRVTDDPTMHNGSHQPTPEILWARIKSLKVPRIFTSIRNPESEIGTMGKEESNKAPLAIEPGLELQSDITEKSLGESLIEDCPHDEAQNIRIIQASNQGGNEKEDLSVPTPRNGDNVNDMKAELLSLKLHRDDLELKLTKKDEDIARYKQELSTLKKIVSSMVETQKAALQEKDDQIDQFQDAISILKFELSKIKNKGNKETESLRKENKALRGKIANALKASRRKPLAAVEQQLNGGKTAIATLSKTTSSLSQGNIMLKKDKIANVLQASYKAKVGIENDDNGFIRPPLRRRMSAPNQHVPSTKDQSNNKLVCDSPFPGSENDEKWHKFMYPLGNMNKKSRKYAPQKPLTYIHV